MGSECNLSLHVNDHELVVNLIHKRVFRTLEQNKANVRKREFEKISTINNKTTTGKQNEMDCRDTGRVSIGKNGYLFRIARAMHMYKFTRAHT